MTVRQSNVLGLPGCQGLEVAAAAPKWHQQALQELLQHHEAGAFAAAGEQQRRLCSAGAAVWVWHS